MFYVPKDAIYRRVSRRKFLELGGSAIAGLGAGAIAVGLGSTIFRNPVYAASASNVAACRHRNFDDFTSEMLVWVARGQVPKAFELFNPFDTDADDSRKKLKSFHDLTGIEVEILTDDLPVVQQKIGIDLRGGKADFQLNYVQDKPIGAPFADFFEDLLPLTKDDTLPQDPEGYGAEVWFENFLDACGYYYTRDRLVAFPYDSAVACTFYRQDLFEKLSKDFESEHSYRLEFTGDTTWKQVNEIAAFFKKMHAKDAGIPYGYAQHQGSFAWTTQLDIQRMLFARGQWTAHLSGLYPPLKLETTTS